MPGVRHLFPAGCPTYAPWTEAATSARAAPSQRLAASCRKLLRGEDHTVSCHRVDDVANLSWPIEPAQPATASHTRASLRAPGSRGDERRASMAADGSRACSAKPAACWPSTACRSRSALARSLGWWVNRAVASPPWVDCCCACCRRAPGRCALAAGSSRRKRIGTSAVVPRWCSRSRIPRLNPRQTVGVILQRAVQVVRMAHGASAKTAEVDRLLDLVRLPATTPAAIRTSSGGEKQRVGIARALASGPEFLVCDEAVSALDVSVQAAILNLLRDLRDELGVAYLFISHDIGVIAHIADRMAVMYHGTIVEEGPVDDVLQPPYHPYTELLLSSVPLIAQGSSQPGGGSRHTLWAQRRAAAIAARCTRRVGPIWRQRRAAAATGPGQATPFFVTFPWPSWPPCHTGSAAGRT